MTVLDSGIFQPVQDCKSDSVSLVQRYAIVVFCSAYTMSATQWASL